MSRYGVVLATSDLPETFDVYELNDDLWVEKRVLSPSEQGKPRKVLVIDNLEVLEKALTLPQFVATVFSDGEGVWGPMNPDYVRDRLRQKRAVT